MNTAIRRITKSQVKMIHTLVSVCRYTEAEYRVMLHMNYKVVSSKDLTFDQARLFIDAVEERAIEAGVWIKNEGPSRFSNLKNRLGMASPAQLRKIEALWAEITDASTEEGKKKGLRAFLAKRFHVSDLRFIEEGRVTGILNALRHMKSRKNANCEKRPETREAAL